MATRPKSVHPWHQLLDALLTQQAELSAEIAHRMQRQLSVYQELAAETFERYVAMAVECTIRLARADPPRLSERQTLVLEQVGEAQARLAVPVDQMLLAWRIGADVLVERGSAEAARIDLGDRQLLAFVRGALAASDVGMITTARAHRRAELEQDREAQDRRASFVRAVLFGGGEPAELRARPAPDAPWRTVEQAVGLATSARENRGMSVLVDGDLAGFQLDPPGDAAPGRAGVGPSVPLDRLAESFRLATRALDTLQAFGMAGTRDLADLGLRPAVAGDPDVGAALRRRYLEPLAESGSGAEIAATLRAYLAAGSHVETAAERLHIHSNTLRYRLSRFEELAGVSLRDPLVPFELWWALERAFMDPA